MQILKPDTFDILDSSGFKCLGGFVREDVARVSLGLVSARPP